MNLYRKVRPTSFDDVIGNEAELKAFQSKLKKKDTQVFVISGASGTGKTTIARIAGTMLGADAYSITEINSANNRGIDTARDLQEDLKYSVSEENPKIVIIDEAHGTTKDWKRAMLKPLEDTPKNVYFFLCTTDPKQLYKGDEGKAIKTRCTEIKMGNLNSDDLYRLLRRTAKSEKLEIPKTVLKEIAENSEGSPRQALTLLEKIMDLKEESDMLASIKMPEEEEKLSIDLCRKLLTAKKWNDVSPILKGLKEVDEESIRYAVLGYANAVLLNSGNPRCAVIIECFSEPFYNSKKAGLSLACYQVIFGE